MVATQIFNEDPRRLLLVVETSPGFFGVVPDPEVVAGTCKINFEHGGFKLSEIWTLEPGGHPGGYPLDPEISSRTRRLYGNPEVLLDPEIFIKNPEIMGSYLEPGGYPLDPEIVFELGGYVGARRLITNLEAIWEPGSSPLDPEIFIKNPEVTWTLTSGSPFKECSRFPLPGTQGSVPGTTPCSKKWQIFERRTFHISEYGRLPPTPTDKTDLKTTI
ncbi:hypothetical protein F2Q68_00016382 [Brassica cretica]|uniref:Uncharacterized protein n=1 Tax=Brassica cretica TaxID=69181 RepID=A0A8S9HRG5_BRACR|nr:hypothetical protein F2Q68_00016382 [Brassica cretica]